VPLPSHVGEEQKGCQHHSIKIGIFCREFSILVRTNRGGKAAAAANDIDNNAKPTASNLYYKVHSVGSLHAHTALVQPMKPQYIVGLGLQPVIVSYVDSTARPRATS